MSNIEEALSSRLTGDVAVSALIATRLYPARLPQDVTYPAVVYTRIDTEPTSAFGTAATLMNSRVQFDCWAKTYSEVKAVANAIRASLDALDTTILSVRIYGIVYSSELDIFEDETQLYRIQSDFQVMYTQT